MYLSRLIFLHTYLGDTDAAAQRGPLEPSGRRTTWMELCLEDVGAHFGFTALIPDPDGGGLDSVRPALSWRLTLDFVLGHLCFGPWVIAFVRANKATAA